MWNTILGIGASFDWISPLAAVLGDVMNGPSHTFLIPYSDSPLSGSEIAWMLSKRGVRSWGHMVISGTLTVSVRLGQARWAQYLLEQAGVPIENPLAGQHQPRSGGRRPPQGSPVQKTGYRRKSDLGAIAESVNDLLDRPLF